jgi:hypothetical protein
MSEILVVIEWTRFQHYKDRDPPWIKLYRDILTSEPWVVGTDLSRLVQIAITLLAARYQNKTPYRFDLIKKVTSLDCTEAQFKRAIAHLIDARFLTIETVQDASAVLAPLYHSATPEGESEKRREETETEGERAGARPPLVAELDAKAWETWIAYRSALKKPLKAPSIEAAQRQLARFGARQQAVVEQSIGNGWQGLFELKTVNGAGKAHRKPKTVAELEAEAANAASGS